MNPLVECIAIDVASLQKSYCHWEGKLLEGSNISTLHVAFSSGFEGAAKEKEESERFKGALLN